MSIYSFGCNKTGQLGVVGDDQLSPVLLKTLKDKVIIDIVAGEEFSMALTEMGDVYTWGRGKVGQLGHGNRESSEIPKLVSSLAHEKIIKIAAGWQHALALTNTGKLYTWGSLHTLNNKKSFQTFGVSVQLPGLETQKILEKSSLAYFAGGNMEKEEAIKFQNYGSFVSKIEESPVKISFFDDLEVETFAAGYAFTLVVTKDGAVYSFGVNEAGQLGHGHRFNTHAPTRIEMLRDERVVQVACGQQHCVALTADARVFTWGLGVFGQLGHGRLKSIRVPLLVDGVLPSTDSDAALSRPVSVHCGAHFTYILRADGQPLVFGHSEFGQHAGEANHADWTSGATAKYGRSAVHEHALPRIPPALKGRRVLQLACGSLHIAAVIVADGRTTVGSASNAQQAKEMNENDDNDDESTVSSVQNTTQLVTFGWGSSGTLGHGDRRFQLVPKEVQAISGINVARVACGWKHTLCLASDSSSFALDFGGALYDAQSTDVTFVTRRGKSLYAHSAVLRARAPLWIRFLAMQMRFCQDKPMTVDSKLIVQCGVQLQVMRAVLNYIYTDQLVCPPHLYVAVERLGVAFGMQRLVKLARRRALLGGYKRVRAEKRSVDGRLVKASRAAAASAIDIPPSTLSRDFASLLAHSASDECDVESVERRAADVRLLIDQHSIGAHRFMLAARSEYFRQLLDGGFAESGKAQLRLFEVEPDVMRAVLRYLYTGDTISIINADNAVDLLVAADMFLIEPLKQRCERFLLDNLSLDHQNDDNNVKDKDDNAHNDDDDNDEDVGWIAALAEKHNAPKLSFFFQQQQHQQQQQQNQSSESSSCQAVVN